MSLSLWTVYICNRESCLTHPFTRHFRFCLAPCVFTSLLECKMSKQVVVSRIQKMPIFQESYMLVIQLSTNLVITGKEFCR